MKKHFLGVEIGGTKLQLVTGDGELNIIEKLRYNIDKEKGSPGIQAQLKEGIEKLLQDFDIKAAGIGFGGPINFKTGRILTSHQISGWNDFNLITFVSGITGTPVFADNDANVACLGEAVKGAGKTLNKVFYITLGSGVGGGMVINKQIYHGAAGGEVEIGHVRLDKAGTTVESRCSGWAVDKTIRSLISQHPESSLTESAGNQTSGEAKFLKEALESKDALAEEILNDFSDNLAFGLSHVIHLFHPEILIIGGGLSLIGESLIKAIEENISKYMMKAFLPAPEITLANLGEDVVPIGALALAKLNLNLIKAKPIIL